VGTAILRHIGTTMHAEREGTRTADSQSYVGASMTTIQAVFLGIMVALAPSILLALVFWRDEIALGEDQKADLPRSGFAD
jgi:hypothetical protein